MSPSQSRLQAGLSSFARGELKRARRSFLDVVLAGGADAPWAVQQLVQTYYQVGAIATAESVIATNLDGDLARAELTNPASALAALALGYLFRRTRRKGAAARLLTESSESPSTRWPSRIELAGLEADAGRSDDAFRLLRRCERHYQTVADNWGLAATHVQIAAVLIDRLELERAGKSLERALAIRTAHNDRFGVAHTLQLRAKVRYLKADYAGALDSLKQALTIHGAAGHLLEQGVLWSNIGLWYLDLASPHQARDAFITARRLFRRIGDDLRDAVVLANLGHTSRLLCNASACVRYYRQALDRLASPSPHSAYNFARTELAAAHTTFNRPRQSLQLLDQVTRAGLAGMSVRERVSHDLARTRALIEDENVALALTELRNTKRRLARHSASSDLPIALQLESLTTEGLVLIADGAARRAETTLSSAIERLDSLLETQPDALIRMGLLETHREAHDLLCRARLAKSPPDVEGAWESCARVKARELRRSRRVKQRRTQRQSVPVDAAKSSVGLNHLTRLSRVLGNTVLLEYHVSRRTTLVFIVQRGEVQVVDLGVGESQLRCVVDNVLAPVRSVMTDDDPVRSLARFDLKSAAAVYRMLIAPVVATLGKHLRRVLIVPDGPLHNLPFEMLVQSVKAADNLPPAAALDRAHYLVEALDISYASSSRLVGRCVPRQQHTIELLAFGYSPPTTVPFHTAGETHMLAAIAGIERELTALSEHIGGTQVVQGSAASITSYGQLAPGARRIHIAAHAIADIAAPGLSGIVLAAATPSEPLSLLTADDIRTTPLRAELVVLSTCDSGRGQHHSREGILSLARAFLEAGAEAVVASMWPVDDQSAVQLMAGFYQRLARGDDRTVALAAAKRELRCDLDGRLFAPRANPYFWAPFVLLDHCPSG